MPSAVVILGAYTETVDPGLSPPGGIVGGDGSVDDGSDSTYVVIRMQRKVVNSNLMPTGYAWFPAAVDLPEYAALDGSPVIEVRLRTELLQTYAAVTAPVGSLRVYQDGPLAGFFGPAYIVDYGVDWRTENNLNTDGHFTLSEDRWNEFRTGVVEVGASNNRPSPTTAATAGEEERIAVYEIELTIRWALRRTKAPPCRITGRADNLGAGSGRIWPPPNTHQSSNRRGGGSTY